MLLLALASVACANDTPTAQAADVAATRWVDAQPVRGALPERIASRFRTRDVLAYATPGVLYPQRAIGLQCQGANQTLADAPQLSARAERADGSRAMRFGEAASGGVRAFRLQIDKDDVLPGDISARCELLAYPLPGTALPKDGAFWVAFSMWVDDWSNTTDEQIIAQLHVQEPTKAPLNPFFSMIVKGSTLRIELRHNEHAPPIIKSLTKMVTAAQLPMPARRWVTTVIHASTASDNGRRPFLQLWLDDRQVVDYQGPLGYMLGDDGHPYAKFGVYHWRDGNPWDARLPQRAMLVGSLLVLGDRDGRYDAAALRAAVAPIAPKQ